MRWRSRARAQRWQRSFNVQRDRLLVAAPRILSTTPALVTTRAQPSRLRSRAEASLLCCTVQQCRMVWLTSSSDPCHKDGPVACRDPPSVCHEERGWCTALGENARCTYALKPAGSACGRNRVCDSLGFCGELACCMHRHAVHAYLLVVAGSPGPCRL